MDVRMNSLPARPKQIKGGLVSDAASGAIKRTLALRYNPDTLSRSDQVQSTGGRCVPSQLPEQSPTALPHGIISQPSAPDMGGHISTLMCTCHQSPQRAGLYSANGGSHRA